jgi:hypothetical protein
MPASFSKPDDPRLFGGEPPGRVAHRASVGRVAQPRSRVEPCAHRFVRVECARRIRARQLPDRRPPGRRRIGVAFGFCPFVFAHLSHIQLLMTAGLPLSLLCFHRLVTRVARARDRARHRARGSNLRLRLLRHLRRPADWSLHADHRGAQPRTESAGVLDGDPGRRRRVRSCGGAAGHRLRAILE